jgi:hypothetical protein
MSIPTEIIQSWPDLDSRDVTILPAGEFPMQVCAYLADYGKLRAAIRVDMPDGKSVLFSVKLGSFLDAAHAMTKNCLKSLGEA